MVRRLYELYAHPLTRIVQGVPASWDPVVVTTKCSHDIQHAVWSPCSRFIAIDCDTEIQILDGVTLKRVKSLAPRQSSTQLLTFSADSRLFTRLSREPEGFISWDLQTGVPVSTIISLEQGEGVQHHPERHVYHNVWWGLSITYSGCGTMFGVLFKDLYGITIIITYSVLSSASVCSYPVEGAVVDMIWTHDQSIRFATLGAESITIWEVGFVPEHPATEVESIPTPNNFDRSREFLFLPALSRLAFVLEDAIFVWDAQHAKLLLSCVDIEGPKQMAFSSDGRFFACRANGPEIYLWKDSPAGYTLHQKLMSSARSEGYGLCIPRFSPDGQSILAFNNLTLQLWHTTTSLSSAPTQAFQNTSHFVLGFSPDESLAVTARLGDNTATVLDLKTGVPQLTIDAGMRIHCLGVAGGTVGIVCNGKIVTWNLPQRDHVLNATANIDDNIRTTIFDHFLAPFLWEPSASISPDFNHIAIPTIDTLDSQCLGIYDMTTGKYLVGIKSDVYAAWFAPNGHEIWSRSFSDEMQGWAIVKDSESDLLKIELLEPTQRPPEGCPWISPHGYRITDDGWILDSNGKRSFWLPPHWRSSWTYRMWSGRFLALLHYQLPEVVILEVLEE